MSSNQSVYELDEDLSSWLILSGSGRAKPGGWLLSVCLLQLWDPLLCAPDMKVVIRALFFGVSAMCYAPQPL